MAEKKPGSRRGSNPVKPPTIDLKAEKVEEAASAGTAKPAADTARADKAGASSKPAASHDAKQAETAATAKPKPAQEKEQPKVSVPMFDSSQMAKYAGFAGAGVLGAVLAMVVGYGASLLGSTEPVMTVPPELTARLDALEQQVAQNGAQDDTAAIDALRSALQDALKGSAAARETLGKDIAGLDAALGDLKSRLDAMAASGVDGAPVEAIAGIEAAIATLKDEIAVLKAAPPAGSAERLEGLEAKVAGLETDMAAAGAAATSLEKRVIELSERVASASGASGAGNAGSAEAAQALALAELREAVSRGGPFVEELDALRALAPGGAVLDGLDDAAAAGVATRRSLEMDFSQALPGVLSAAHMREDAGILARLFDNARGIVTVRPVGALDGDSPEAIVARIETRLADGDLAGALADWQALPQQARDAAGAWGVALAKKVSVDAAINDFSRAVISGLKNAS